MEKLANLRKKFPKFVYEKYGYKLKGNDLIVSFKFSVEPDIFFNPSIKIKNLSETAKNKIKTQTFENLVFNLGMVEIYSYWKASCSPEILVRAGFLNKKQIDFWRNLLTKGMGEFFYANKIDFRLKNFVKYKIDSNKKFKKINFTPKNKKVLVPMAGGKDSIVSLELLKSEFDVNCFCLNPIKASLNVMKTAGIKKPLIVEREIDQNLLDLNKKGFLNGHTPFSAYLHFLSLLLAYLFDFKYVAFSNEKSADEENIRYLGKKINHQYSKSSDFEEKFRKYYKEFILQGIEIFSFLRHLSELEISYIFSGFKKYFPVFLSCNKPFTIAARKSGSKAGWCGECPKCFSSFVSLYPFLEKQEILKIFNKNLFEDKKLLATMKSFLDEKKPKPFECVLTRKELKTALSGSIIKEKRNKLPYLLKYYANLSTKK
ncbi:MAG: hypothetical protein Q8O39_00960 [bacterium]|nr:hypothetical protein [bacterium]